MVIYEKRDRMHIKDKYLKVRRRKRYQKAYEPQAYKVTL